MNPINRYFLSGTIPVTGRRLLIGICTLSLLIGAIPASRWFLFRGARSSVSLTPIAEIPIPEPYWGDSAKEAREHVQQIRLRLDALKAEASAPRTKLARAYGELGSAYLAYDLSIPASASFRNATRLDPAEFRWWYLLATSELGSMDSLAAVDAMREAVARIGQGSVASKDDLVAAYCFLGDGCVRLNRSDEARGYFDRAIEIDPTCVFALFKRGQLASQAGESEKAIDDFQNAFSQYPTDKPVPIALALSVEYQRLGQHDLAARHRPAADSGLKEVTITYANPLLANVRSSSQRPSAVLARVRAALSKGKVQAAIAHLDEHLSIAPHSFEMRLVRAEVLLQMNRIEDAIRDLETVCDDAPTDERARLLLIQLYSRRPETRQKAFEVAAKWSAEQPTLLQPQLLLATVEFRRERFERAYEIYSAASAMFSRELQPRLGEIFSLCALGRYAAARERFDAALESFRDDVDLKHNFSRFLVTCPDAMVREPQRGLTVVQELQSSVKSTSLRETFACALASCGKFDDARRELSSLVSDEAAAERTSTKFQYRALRESLERGQPLRERWPFSESGGPIPSSPFAESNARF